MKTYFVKYYYSQGETWSVIIKAPYPITALRIAQLRSYNESEFYSELVKVECIKQ